MIPTRYKDFYGDETRWFIGRVVSVQDPLELGRVRLRIMGIHSENTEDIPDKGLPWAQTLLPITEGGTAGLGIHTGIQVNARVFGVFLDGTNSQLPLVLGSMPKLEDDSEGGRSTNQLARGTNTIEKTPDEVTDEPENPYNAIYPLNQVHQTARGHVIEIDDSFDSNGSYERIHIYHASGTFIEMHPNGDVVTHHKNGFRTVTGNDKLHVTENMEITVDGDLNLVVKGNVTEDITGNVTTTIGKNLSETIKSNASKDVKGSDTESISSNKTITTGGVINLN